MEVAAYTLFARRPSSTDAVAASASAASAAAAVAAATVAVGVELPRRWPRENGFGLAAASHFAIGQTRLSMRPGVRTRHRHVSAARLARVLPRA